MQKFKKIRKDYKLASLDEKNSPKDPFKLFKTWLNHAIKAGTIEANAMSLATADQNMQPSCRIVLLKHFDNNGFIFFTNYNSRKAAEISKNKKVAATFFWAESERQIRIEGKIKKVSQKISDQYFAQRPLGAKLSAIVSPQSQEIKNRQYLERKINNFQNNNDQIKRPRNWGGYIIQATKIEFWQGRQDRLHDRIVYKHHNKNIWIKKRLAP